MAKSNKVIITCAVTGAIHTPSMSPHLPVTPEQIADAAIGADPVFRHIFPGCAGGDALFRRAQRFVIDVAAHHTLPFLHG